MSQTLLPRIQDVTDKVLDPEAITAVSLRKDCQDPTGWRLLILPYRGKGKTDGGIYLPDAVVEEQTSIYTGWLCPQSGASGLTGDTEKFPSGPWCEQGDWVMFARYAGSRFKIDGGEVRILER